LLAIGIMTDTDNTRSSTTAWYGPVQLGAASPGGPAALILLRCASVSPAVQGLRETPFDVAGTLAA
jgi:hypothetical protein